MKAIAYSQAQGFYDIELDYPEGPSNEHLSDELRRYGFSDPSILSGEEILNSWQEWRHIEPGGAWHSVFVIDDGDRSDLVFVKSPSESLALRLRLTEWVSQNTAVQTQRLLDVAAKAFRASHGHSNFLSCDTCDPEGANRDRELLAARTRGQKARE